jgi:hypothetical protein
MKEKSPIYAIGSATLLLPSCIHWMTFIESLSLTRSIEINARKITPLQNWSIHSPTTDGIAGLPVSRAQVLRLLMPLRQFVPERRVILGSAC